MSGLCRMFVRGPADRAALVDIVSTVASGEVDGFEVAAESWEAEIRNNIDDGAGLSEDFLFWPLCIEWYGLTDEADLQTPVARVLMRLWESGHGAVAACDFEDQLPEQGGIARFRPPSGDVREG
jgi:hypothetical protein